MKVNTTAFSKVTSVEGEGIIAQVNGAVRTLQALPVVGDALAPVRAVTETAAALTSGGDHPVKEAARGIVRTAVSTVPGVSTVDAALGGRIGNVVAEHVIGKATDVAGSGGMPGGGSPATPKSGGNKPFLG